MKKTFKFKHTGNPGVSPVGFNESQSIGFGYIYIPEETDRDEYIETCYRSLRVSVIDDLTGQQIKNCIVTPEAIQNIVFPEEVGEIGTPVVWVSQTFRNQPIIIGTLLTEDEIVLRGEQEFSFQKRIGNTFVKLIGSAKSNLINLTLQSDEDSVISINASGSNSLIKINSSENIEIESNAKTTITSYDKLDAKVVDAETKNESGIYIDKEKVVVGSKYGDGSEKNSFTTTVTDKKVSTEINIDGSTYKNEIDKDKALFQFMDSLVELKNGTATVKQGDSFFEIDKNKMAMINSATGLNAILTKIADIINTLQVSTPMGPSGTPLPPTIQGITELKKLLSNFFNK